VQLLVVSDTEVLHTGRDEESGVTGHVLSSLRQLQALVATLPSFHHDGLHGCNSTVEMIHDVIIIGNYLYVLTPPHNSMWDSDQIGLGMQTWETMSTHLSKINSHLAAAAAVGLIAKCSRVTSSFLA
jgi:hypothetical protein